MKHPACLLIVVGLLVVRGSPVQAESEHEGHESAPAAAESEAKPPPPPLLPDLTTEEAAKQPFGLVRTLQSTQDEVAQGSTTAHVFQRTFMAQLNEDLRRMPATVWEDPRNARAAVIFVFSGGDPRIIGDMMRRPSPPPVEARLLKAALAFGEGRSDDAERLLDVLDARRLDGSVAGLAALIHGMLASKKDAKKAIAMFDDARLLAPGTLVEETALRQEILLLAKEGDFERFDALSSQYSRRFAKSIYASNFRRQFFAGVARQDFKGASEWISRTESELLKLAPSERADAYLSIAEEALQGGNIVIARFAAANAATLSPAGGEAHERANLVEGGALIFTDDFARGIETLTSIDKDKLRPRDRDIHAAALGLASRIYKWPDAPSHNAEPLPAPITQAQTLISSVDAMLAGEVQ